MIPENELVAMNQMSQNDPGMKDLLDRAHEYYLLKRTKPAKKLQKDTDSDIRKMRFAL